MNVRILRKAWHCVLEDAMNTSINLWSHLAQFSLEWKMFQTKVVERIKTHFLSNNSFWKSCRLWNNVEKYRRAGKVIDENTAHAHCMLNTSGYLYSEYVILIVFPLQQWLHESSAMLIYTCNACLVDYYGKSFRIHTRRFKEINVWKVT